MNVITTDMGERELFATLKNLFGEEMGEFSPCVIRFPGESLIYLVEDVSYVADRLGYGVSVLWHPSEERLVGVELEPADGLLKQMERVCEVPIDRESDFPFRRLFELAVVSVVDDHRGTDRIRELLDQAREMVQEVMIPSRIVRACLDSTSEER